MATATRTRRAPARKVGTCCPLPLQTPDGRVVMDWHAHNAGDPKPCRACRRPAFCRDCTGTPCHKTCAELELARDLAHPSARNRSPIGV